MKKKIFAISDIHGDFKAMVQSLSEAGYEVNNPDHFLVVCGDMFDRGDSSLSVYEYLKGLTDSGKAIVVRGNHEGMFIDYLTGKNISPFNYFHNGTRETFADFLHETSPFESWCLIEQNIEEPTNLDFAKWLEYARKQINKEYPELLPWLRSLPYYYETKHYIYTHGAIDTKAKDWHHPHCEKYHYTDWEALTWNDGSFFGEYIGNTDKTVVIGHFHTRHLREMYGIPSTEESKDNILEREDGKVIAIDTCTPLTHRVNVLILSEEELI